MRVSSTWTCSRLQRPLRPLEPTPDLTGCGRLSLAAGDRLMAALRARSAHWERLAMRYRVHHTFPPERPPSVLAWALRCPRLRHCHLGWGDEATTQQEVCQTWAALTEGVVRAPLCTLCLDLHAGSALLPFLLGVVTHARPSCWVGLHFAPGSQLDCLDHVLSVRLAPQPVVALRLGLAGTALSAWGLRRLLRHWDSYEDLRLDLRRNDLGNELWTVALSEDTAGLRALRRCELQLAGNPRSAGGAALWLAAVEAVAPHADVRLLW